MKGLIGKRVLITGGAGAIGTATAKRFVEEGARVYVFDRDEAACRGLKKDLPDLEGYILGDVADPGSVTRAFEELDKRAGGLDILINNAGISIRHSFLDITAQEWRQPEESCLNLPFPATNVGTPKRPVPVPSPP